MRRVTGMPRVVKAGYSTETWRANAFERQTESSGMSAPQSMTHRRKPGLARLRVGRAGASTRIALRRSESLG